MNGFIRYKPADPESLLKAFQVLDQDNHGYILKGDLEKAVMEIGEPFTTQELNEMMSVACDPQTNKINYEHYINLLIVSILILYHLFKIIGNIAQNTDSGS